MKKGSKGWNKEEEEKGMKRESKGWKKKARMEAVAKYLGTGAMSENLESMNGLRR